MIDNQRKSKSPSFAKVAMVLGIGYLVGTLFAPRSGIDTRKNIADKAKKAKEELKRSAQE